MSPLLLRIILLVVLPLTAYSFMLSSPFKTLDDQYSIVGNDLIKDPTQWQKLFTQGYFGDKSYYRPLANLSFMVEHKFFGLNSFFYNFDNLLIHILNGILIWLIVSYLVNAELGFWVALLFSIHPVQWESVANISGRAIILSTLFGSLSFLLYLKNRLFWAIMAFIPALLCKESAAIMPGIMFLHSYFYRKSIAWIVPFGLVTAAYMGVRHYFGITETYPWRNSEEFILGFMTFLRSVIVDVRILALPIDLHFDRAMPLFTAFDDPQLILTALIWLAFVVWLFIDFKKLNPLHKLCLAWFGLAMLPVSQILTTIGVQPGYISTAEHFLYIACVPIFIVVVDLLLYIRKDVFRGIMVAFLAFFFITTIEQNIYAQSELAMLERSLGIQPHNARLQSSVGMIYAMSRNFKQAEKHFRLAVDGDLMNVRYRISLGKSICDQGLYDECLRMYDTIKEPGRYAELLENNRNAAIRLRDRQKLK